MTHRQLSQDMKNRLTYLVFCKQLSVAIVRGYTFYNNTTGLSTLWGYSEQETEEISSLIMNMFEIYKKEKTISESNFYLIAQNIPIILPFVKESPESKIRRWLLGMLLPSEETNEGPIINESSYNTAFGFSTRFLDYIEQVAEDERLFNSVWMELYNPLIHQGIAPTKISSISGINSINAHLIRRFGELAKAVEISSTEMLALVSEHIFSPEVRYLGNIYEKSLVDDIHPPKLQQEEVRQILLDRMNLIRENFPNASLEDLNENNAKPFKTIDPLKVFARHYGFVDGDLVELNSIIPSDSSMSSRKSELYLVS